MPTPSGATTQCRGGPPCPPSRSGCTVHSNPARRNVSQSKPAARSGVEARPDLGGNVGSTSEAGSDLRVWVGSDRGALGAGATRRRGGGGDDASRGRARGPAPTGVVASDAVGLAHAPLALGDVVQRFKSLTTARYRHGVLHHGWAPFRGRLWQRNYYERIIRDRLALRLIRAYIQANPAKWGAPRRPARPGRTT
jgi:hypothetical protein